MQNGRLFFIPVKMIKLMDEIEECYVFTKENCGDTTTTEGLEVYKLMTNCIEQYRREIANNIFIKHKKEPIYPEVMEKLAVGETNLHLKGTLHQRLLQILESNL